MTDPVEFLADGLAAAGVDPRRQGHRKAYGDWMRALQLARAIVLSLILADRVAAGAASLAIKD